MLYIFSDPDDDRPKKKRPSRAVNVSTSTLRAATLSVLSVLLLNCSTPPKAPTIVGKAEVLAVDTQAGTVTLTLSLYRRLLRRLTSCDERLRTCR